MAAADRELVDRDAGLVRLLDPPLAHAEPSAGYIQAYPPGVRENGGQYSHAGVWAVMAQAALGDADAAYRYFTYLSPAHRSRRTDRAETYRIEPYVMAGDTYSAAPYVGRGGWSWYTGSAAWMHRAAIESIFGISQRNDELVVRPCLPSAWTQAELRLTRAGKSVRLLFVRATDATPESLAAAASARLLGVGEAVRWSSLDGAVPLLVVMADSSKSSQDAAAAELANAG
jgi:cyclic beta-1,2-glucan synthetase